jgi:RNA:NAD 2'-phosphotransferase (TPT1/KptA family)
MTAMTDARPRTGGPATLKIYNAVFGYSEKQVRKFRIGEVRPHAQYDHSVDVDFTEPRKRNSKYTTIVPTSSLFVTIDVDGATVYDSRADVHCDMDEWRATNARFRGERPFRTVRIGVDGSVVSDSADDPDPEPPPFDDGLF